MNWRECESLKTLIKQLNAKFPTRSKVSDGTIGDARHKAEKSDHNPNAAGAVRALDVTHDPASGCTGDWLSEVLVEAKDHRVTYLIWNHRMISSYPAHGYPAWVWRPYTGFSPHTEHVHISVSADSKLYDDAGSWNLDGSATPPTPVAITPRDLKLGDKGNDVMALQKALGIIADGDFGPDTAKAVKGFQHANGLRVDGVAGSNTRAALGI